MQERVRTYIALGITLVWAVNFIAPVFVKDYSPPPEVHIIFLAIVTGILALKSPKNSDSDDEDEDKPSRRK